MMRDFCNENKGKDNFDYLKRDSTHVFSEDPNYERLVEFNIPSELTQYLTSEETEIEKFCRICLTVQLEMIPVFTTDGGGSIVDMLTSFTSFRIFDGDGFPPKICINCKDEIIHCFQFQQRCEKSYNAFQTVLKGGIICKVETTEADCNENDCSENTRNEMKNSVDMDLLDDEGFTYFEVPEIKNEPDGCSIDDIKIDPTASEITYSNEEIIYCNTCGKHCKDMDQLMKHMKIHDTKSYSCSQCLKKFVKLKSLNLHMKMKHNVSKDVCIKCSDCDEAFSTERDLNIHFSLHTKNGKWECNECKKCFVTKTQLKRHLGRHMDEKKYKCDVCSKPFSEYYALTRHKRTHTGEAIERKHACTLCNKRYVDSSALRVHMLKHTGERPCVCAVCGKSFPSIRLLNSHMLTHNDYKPHKCKYCEKRFRHESTRNTHHRTHTGEKPYVCSTCGKTFIQSSNLTLHMRTHSGEKPYACTSCDRKFTSWTTLKTHERTHTGEKPYSCKICGKKFARMNMRVHIRAHTGERPFTCSLCPKRFASAVRLKEHSRIHTGERPFECSTCSQKFATKSQLIKHCKTHEEMFECTTCMQKFSTYSNLLKHVRVHNEERENMLLANNPPTHEDPNIYSQLVYLEKDGCVEESIEDTHMDDDIKITCGTPDMTTEVNQTVSLEQLQTDKEIVIIGKDIPKHIEAPVISYIAEPVDHFVTQSQEPMNLIAVNDAGLSLAASTLGLNSNDVKIYRLDQSLLQIQRVGGQLTISKITSKMTANFE